MKRRHLSLTAFVMAACAPTAAKPPFVTMSARSEEVYRPDWTAGIPEQMDAIRACVLGRQPPVLIVHIESLPKSRTTGITSVDGFGAVENCKAQASRILKRWPKSLRPEDFVGVPVFSLDTDRPSVAVGTVVEEVVHRGDLLGWLYWPMMHSGEAAHGSEAL
jgi:hypothetical protein